MLLKMTFDLSFRRLKYGAFQQRADSRGAGQAACNVGVCAGTQWEARWVK